MKAAINVVDQAMQCALHGSPRDLERSLSAAEFSSMAKRSYRLINAVMPRLGSRSWGALSDTLRHADYAVLGNAVFMLLTEVQKYHDAGLAHRTELWQPCNTAARAIADEMRRRNPTVSLPAPLASLGHR